MTDEGRVTILNEDAVERALARMAREIVERNEGTGDLVLLGIRRRGVELSPRGIRASIESEEGAEVLSGAIDITLYRDDLAQIGPLPVVGESALPMEGIDDRAVVIVDDVFFTGRTARAAHERNSWIGVAPLGFFSAFSWIGEAANFQFNQISSGRQVNVLPLQKVDVRVPEIDGRLAVELSPSREGAT